MLLSIPVQITIQSIEANSRKPSYLVPTVSIMQIIVGVLQAYILWRLTFYIFERNAEQKISERQSGWFHKVVVDPQLLRLSDFFGGSLSALSTAAEKCNQIKSSGSKLEQFDSVAQSAMQKFTDSMLPVRRILIDSTACFDQGLAKTVGELLLNLQDDVTEWFDKFKNSRPTDSRGSLDEIIAECHNKLLISLKEFDFKTWGYSPEKAGWRRLLLVPPRSK